MPGLFNAAGIVIEAGVNLTWHLEIRAQLAEMLHNIRLAKITE
jgi:hypothetical protein